MNQAPIATARKVIATPTMSRTTSEPLWEDQCRKEIPGDQQSHNAGGDIGSHLRQFLESRDVEVAHDREQEEKPEHPGVKWHESKVRREPLTIRQRNIGTTLSPRLVHRTGNRGCPP